MKKLIKFLFLFLILSCTSKTKGFELCDGKLHPYYYPKLSYAGDFYEIKKHFYSGYTRVNETNNTGIIKIRFDVNCKGETGNFKMDNYSLDYKKIQLNNNINGQLLKLTKDLSNWIPGSDKNGEPVNNHKFFAFKIIDGQLIDILPK